MMLHIIIIAALIINIALVTWVLHIIQYRPTYYKQSTVAGSCSASSCGATDPVSDPAYNMRELIKQSILLEEHLVEKNKYCRDCIIKHFLHLIGLAEEAQMLAGSHIDTYPLLKDAAFFYRDNMETWLNDDANTLVIATLLRDFRKNLIAIYYPLNVNATT